MLNVNKNSITSILRTEFVSSLALNLLFPHNSTLCPLLRIRILLRQKRNKNVENKCVLYYNISSVITSGSSMQCRAFITNIRVVSAVQEHFNK